MSKIKIGINGAGRIGRNLMRALIHRQALGELTNVELAAVNNPGSGEEYAHLIKYDSLLGIFPGAVTYANEKMTMGNHSFSFTHHTDPKEIPWDKLGVQIVIDATGFFKDGDALSQHKRGSVKKVIMCAPGKKLDGTFVFGINHKTYQPEKHHIVSNASCTTNCLAPISQVLHDNFEIISGLMVTVHAYTSDQNLLDNSHTDLRRARAAALSMIPTSTGAAKAIGEVIPSLAGKLDGYAVRVPTPNVSMVDLTVHLKKNTSVQEVNAKMKEASLGYLKGVLGYEETPLVSIDFQGRTESSIFDPENTKVMNGNLCKIVSWYDNEFGFSNRVLDLSQYMGSFF